MKTNQLGQSIFFTLAEFDDACTAADNAGQVRENPGFTGETKEESFRFLRQGNPDRVPPCEAIMDKIDAALDLDSPEWQNDVAGAFPDVPAFLAGQPDSMRRRVMTPSERAPVRVWFCTTSSAGFRPDQLAARGAAACALVMALIARGRAVELWTFTALCAGGTGLNGQNAICVRQNSAPFDVASVANAMTSAGFDRGLCMGVARHRNHYRGGWSKHIRHSGSWGDRVQSCRKVLEGLTDPADIILPPIYYDDTILTDPVRWVNETVAACMSPA